MSKSIAMEWWIAQEKAARFKMLKEQLPPPSPYFVGTFRIARPHYIDEHFEYIDELMHEDGVDSVFDLFGAG